jgi:hypothetical protein
MIRNDFLGGGFPICRRCPIICLFDSAEFISVYNNYDLHKVKSSHTIKKMLGIWPGNKDTDIFMLDPEFYGEVFPPMAYKDIDSASDIKIFYKSAELFDRIEYVPGFHVENREKITSNNKDLLNYLRAVRLKNTLVIGE